MDVWPTIFNAASPLTRYAKPPTPTNPSAMPTGTRASIKANRMMKPAIATASVLIAPSHSTGFIWYWPPINSGWTIRR